MFVEWINEWKKSNKWNYSEKSENWFISTQKTEVTNDVS